MDGLLKMVALGAAFAFALAFALAETTALFLADALALLFASAFAFGFALALTFGPFFIGAGSLSDAFSSPSLLSGCPAGICSGTSSAMIQQQSAKRITVESLEPPVSV